MDTQATQEFDVVGLSDRLSNGDPQRIAALWSRFRQSADAATLAKSSAGGAVCVYHDYSGGHMDPFTMTIGYVAGPHTSVPSGFVRVSVPAQQVAVFEVTGAQPDALVAQWKAIWESDLDRAFRADWDTYDPDDPNHVTVRVGLTGTR